LSFPVLGLSAEGEDTAQELNKKAYFLVRQARKALYQEEERTAYDNFVKAGEIYGEITRLFPEWQADSIATKIEKCRKEADEIGRRIFKLPDGYIEIKRDMTREGSRYDKGRIDAAKVKRSEKISMRLGGTRLLWLRRVLFGERHVLVLIIPIGGRKFGFACRHIWAVVSMKTFKQQ